MLNSQLHDARSTEDPSSKANPIAQVISTWSDTISKVACGMLNTLEHAKDVKIFTVFLKYTFDKQSQWYRVW